MQRHFEQAPGKPSERFARISRFFCCLHIFREEAHLLSSQNKILTSCLYRLVHLLKLLHALCTLYPNLSQMGLEGQWDLLDLLGLLDLCCLESLYFLLGL